MPLPNDRAGLTQAGYSFTGVGRCRGCDAFIEWWATPNRDEKTGERKKMPMTVSMTPAPQKAGDPAPREQILPHWGDCKTREAYRNANRQHKARTTKPGPEQGSLL